MVVRPEARKPRQSRERKTQQGLGTCKRNLDDLPGRRGLVQLSSDPPGRPFSLVQNRKETPQCTSPARPLGTPVSLSVGLRMLVLRHVIDERDGLLSARPTEFGLLA